MVCLFFKHISNLIFGHRRAKADCGGCLHKIRQPDPVILTVQLQSHPIMFEIWKYDGCHRIIGPVLSVLT